VTTALTRLKANLLRAGLALGLLQQTPEAWFSQGTNESDETHIQAPIDARSAARQERGFVRADAIRARRAAEGIVLEDTPHG
ncbi:cysteine--tRNA ligase, partial [Xylella fastidiosa subsp. multiplex]|nr:cysteine--tRNA ligase [Xylella fastidiosa subsp. multiplex]